MLMRFLLRTRKENMLLFSISIDCNGLKSAINGMVLKLTLRAYKRTLLFIRSICITMKLIFNHYVGETIWVDEYEYKLNNHQFRKLLNKNSKITSSSLT